MDKKFAIQIIGLVALVILGTFLTKNPDLFNSFLGEPTNFEKIKINDTVINVEIADTSSKRAKGLGGRENLASDSGMLFVFDAPDTHKFWMKGMKIPLDFIWIRDNKVVDLLINAPPPSLNATDSELTIYQPKEAVDQVIEVNSGFINQHKISIGDKIERQK